MTRSKLALLALLFACTVAACGEDDGPDNNVIHGSDAGTDTAADATGDTTDAPDAADGGADTDASSDIVGRSCVAPPENLGTLSPGDTRTLSRTFYGISNQTTATCRQAQDRAGIFWFQIRVDELSVVDFEVTSTLSSAPVIELRRADCQDDSTSQFCTDILTRTETLEPDVDYFLVVQGATGSVDAAFELDLSVQAASCTPGEQTCSSGQVETCPDASQPPQTRDCAEDCTAGTSCAGELCNSALAVDVSTAGSWVSVTGNQQAYAHDWDAEGRTGCNLEAGASAGATPGDELFLKVTGHAAGDTIVFDAEEGSTAFGFYLLDGCSATECMTAGAYDDLGNNHFEWQAASADDFYVVAEVFGPDRDRDFNIRVQRQ